MGGGGGWKARVNRSYLEDKERVTPTGKNTNTGPSRDSSWKEGGGLERERGEMEREKCIMTGMTVMFSGGSSCCRPCRQQDCLEGVQINSPQRRGMMISGENGWPGGLETGPCRVWTAE